MDMSPSWSDDLSESAVMEKYSNCHNSFILLSSWASSIGVRRRVRYMRVNCQLPLKL